MPGHSLRCNEKGVFLVGFVWDGLRSSEDDGDFAMGEVCIKKMSSSPPHLYSDRDCACVKDECQRFLGDVLVWSGADARHFVLD